MFCLNNTMLAIWLSLGTKNTWSGFGKHNAWLHKRDWKCSNVLLRTPGFIATTGWKMSQCLVQNGPGLWAQTQREMSCRLFINIRFCHHSHKWKCLNSLLKTLDFVASVTARKVLISLWKHFYNKPGMETNLEWKKTNMAVNVHENTVGNVKYIYIYIYPVFIAVNKKLWQSMSWCLVINYQFCRCNHGCKTSRCLIKNIRFDTYKYWNKVLNSGLWLGSLLAQLIMSSSSPPNHKMKVSSYVKVIWHVCGDVEICVMQLSSTFIINVIKWSLTLQPWFNYTVFQM